MPRGKGYDVVTDRGVVMDTFPTKAKAKTEAKRLQRLNEGRAVVFTVSKSGDTGRRIKRAEDGATAAIRAGTFPNPAPSQKRPPRGRTDAKMDRLNRLEKALMRLESASRLGRSLGPVTLDEIKKERDRVKNVLERVKEGRPIDPGRLRRGFRDRLAGIRFSLKTDRSEVVGSEKTVDALDDAIKEIEEAL